MVNPVTNFEIVGSDTNTLYQFYSTVFNWEINAYEEGYYWFETGSESDNGIEGHIYPPNDEIPLENGVEFGNNITVYITVEDINSSIMQVKNLGGIILMKPIVVSDEGQQLAMFLDPSGNRIGLYQAGNDNQKTIHEE
ncbi:hypothetical protein JT359_13450 [Candidatus Poribacteria bacterium]|nr:hypothetical protein [Candidatus Poribacteria bacterium]